MAYASLEIICGPMFAGKTTELLTRILRARERDHLRVMVLKPAFDTRYGDTKIATHDGLSVEALPVSRWPEIPDDVQALFLDEVQFLHPPHAEIDLGHEVRKVLARGIPVTGAGLDTDWQGIPFPATAELAAMADHIHKITANCTICGEAAPKTFKKAPNSLQVELGETDKYEARCNAHWHAHQAAGKD